MTDLSDHPFSPQSVALESGAPDKSERAWLRFVRDLEIALGHSVDGNDVDEAGCGYSQDEAYDCFDGQWCSAADFAAEIKERPRYDGGAFVGGHR